MPDMDVASKVTVPVIDPLKTAGQIGSVQQIILNNKLLGQEVQSKIALGQAVTAATDPATGRVDWDKALTGLAKDDRGSFKVPELAASIQERKLKDLQLSQEQVKASLAKLGPVASLSLSLIGGAKETPLTRENIVSAIKSNLIDTGVLGDDDAPMITSFVGQLGDDPVKNQLVLQRLYAQTNGTVEGLNALYGPPVVTDTGGSKVITRTSPATGETAFGTVIPNTLTPQNLAQLVDVYDEATGQTKRVTLGSLLGKPVGDPKAPVNSGGVTTQPAPGVKAAGEAVGAASAKFVTDLTAAADKAPTNIAALRNMRDQLKSFQPGPKANLTYQLGALATMVGVAPPKVTSGVAAQEEFAKLATQFINQQVGALGGTGTDSKLESARHGSPNEFMSREGNQNVISLMIGLENAIVAKSAAWQKWVAAGNDQSTYGKFSTEFNRYYNPRVFQSIYMDEKQRANMLSNMSKDERAKFREDWLFARKAGWIK